MFGLWNRQHSSGMQRQGTSKRFLTRNSVVGVSIAFLALVSVCVVFAAISLSTSTTYTQNFDGIGTSATATLPADFKVDRTITATSADVRKVGTFAAAGTTTTQVGGANLSTSASNGIYNFGSGTGTTGPDRAIGFLASGTATASGDLYAQLVNNTGGDLSGLKISYNVEKYRNGTNAAGFRIQMFYSMDGSTWTSAGSNFLTSFAADANNNGFSPAPGATVAVSNQTLSAPVPNGNNFYLAWNYSVTTGSTVTNAQALAVDDISILGIAGAGSTNPSGVGNANPNSVTPGSSTLLTVAVTPGTNPPSTAHTVTANLTAIGGSASQTFFDDGTNGDLTAGNNIFSFSATVAIGTTGGVKNLPATITETSPLSRTGSASISLTVVTPTPPSGVGAANPNPVAAGDPTLLTVTVTPGANPTSTALTVSGNLSSIGGSANQQFFDDGTNGDLVAGNNVFSFSATVDPGTAPGTKSLPFTITDAQARSGAGNISLTVAQPPVPPGTIVISQIYGGGGNSGAIYKNDFIEIFNRSNTTVSLAGWSVQYASAAGTSWTNKTTLSGSIAPGHYYLVQGAAGTTGDGIDLPAPDATGSINMSATDGKVALVGNNTSLTGGCPLSNPNLIDFVGYGSASCFEGAGPAPGIDNVTADFRTHLGCKDTDSNGGNFTAGTPNARNTSSPTTICPTGDFPPEIFATSPSANEAHVPQDANITINFDEPVNVLGAWFQISCANTGAHAATVSGGPISFTLDPDSDFTFNEPCTVTVFASQVSDQDLDDPPNNMAADYAFSFNSEFLRDPAEHMVMGNPNGATADVNFPNNYLMMKTQYALSFNDSRGIPNWTSWHLDITWRGSAPRQDDFRNDTTLPLGFHQVLGTDYSGSGFDRGHMCPSADRTSTIPDNSATFLMTNMVPQAPDNNQGPWAAFENYLRTLLPGNEIYILSGGTGTGGIGSNGAANTIAGGFVTVPAATWKVALVLPVGDNDVSRVDNNTRTIAVIMPNTNGIRSDQWQKYLATVDQAEVLSGYDFYSNVPTATQDAIEARLDAEFDTAPVVSDQTKTTAEDQGVPVTLSATDVNVNNVFTYTIVDAPLHGLISGSGANLTYSPNPHYFGGDSFTFKANDGALDSNVSTVTITVTEVNNDLVAMTDSKQTPEDSPLIFASSDLTANDSAGPGEGAQTLTVDSVISTPNTHGSILLISGQITYSPAADYNGPASFDYHVCDDGTTNGSPDPKCTTGTVNITVTEVNDVPVATNDSKNTSEDNALNFPASDLTVNDSTGPVNESGQTLTISSVTANGNTHGTVTLNSGSISYLPDANYNGTASFDYQVCDNGTTNGAPDPKCATGTVNITINPVNDAPAANSQSAVTNGNTPVVITLTGSDLETSAANLSYTVTSGPSHGSLSGTAPNLTYTPGHNYSGPDSFKFTVTDTGDGSSAALTSAEATISITVNDTIPPTITAPGNLTVYTGVGATSCSVVVSDATLGTATANDNAGSVSITRSGVPSGNIFPAGTTTITYTATDGAGNTTSATQTVTVIDNTAPTITLNGIAISLSPPNHSYHTISVSDLVASASDNCDPSVNVSKVVISQVTSDEAENGNGDGNTSNDILIAANCRSVQLRAEREGGGDGRVYRITFKVTDSGGNSTIKTALVTVPKSNNGQPAIDSGPHYSVSGNCP